MQHFESVGDNCECGLVQRHWGAEPLALFRFSNIKMPALLRGLDMKFCGLGEEQSLRPYYDIPGVNGRREIMINDDTFDYFYHTNIHEGDKSLEETAQLNSRILKRMRLYFVDNLTHANRIFVHKMTNTRPSLANILPMFFALRRWGPNTLLWVLPEDDLHAAGTTEIITEGLILGYVDKLSNLLVEHDVSYDRWLEVLDNALKQSQEWRSLDALKG